MAVVAVLYGLMLTLLSALMMLGMWMVSQSPSVDSVGLGGFFVSLLLVIPAVFVGVVASTAAILQRRWAVRSFAGAGWYFLGAVLPSMVFEVIGTGDVPRFAAVFMLAFVVPSLLFAGVMALNAIERKARYVALLENDEV